MIAGLTAFPAGAQDPNRHGGDIHPTVPAVAYGANVRPVATGVAGYSSCEKYNSHRDCTDALVYQDRQALKALRLKLKAARTDEERASLKSAIAQLEKDIIALQQQ